MALNKLALVNDLIALQQKMIKKDTDDFSSYANGFADAIEKFVKSGQVNAGIPVSTTGTATAQTGTTTGTGTIS
jgi:hypothetical protein